MASYFYSRLWTLVLIYGACNVPAAQMHDISLKRGTEISQRFLVKYELYRLGPAWPCWFNFNEKNLISFFSFVSFSNMAAKTFVFFHSLA